MIPSSVLNPSTETKYPSLSTPPCPPTGLTMIAAFIILILFLLKINFVLFYHGKNTWEVKFTKIGVNTAIIMYFDAFQHLYIYFTS